MRLALTRSMKRRVFSESTSIFFTVVLPRLSMITSQVALHLRSRMQRSFFVLSKVDAQLLA